MTCSTETQANVQEQVPAAVLGYPEGMPHVVGVVTGLTRSRRGSGE